MNIAKFSGISQQKCNITAAIIWQKNTNDHRVKIYHNLVIPLLIVPWGSNEHIYGALFLNCPKFESHVFRLPSDFHNLYVYTIIHSVKEVSGIDHSKSPLKKIVKNLFDAKLAPLSSILTWSQCSQNVDVNGPHHGPYQLITSSSLHWHRLVEWGRHNELEASMVGAVYVHVLRTLLGARARSVI